MDELQGGPEHVGGVQVARFDLEPMGRPLAIASMTALSARPISVNSYVAPRRDGFTRQWRRLKRRRLRIDGVLGHRRGGLDGPAPASRLRGVVLDPRQPVHVHRGRGSHRGEPRNTHPRPTGYLTHDQRSRRRRPDVQHCPAHARPCVIGPASGLLERAGPSTPQSLALPGNLAVPTHVDRTQSCWVRLTELPSGSVM
jgi:hypothetical protein